MTDWAITINLGGEKQTGTAKDGTLTWTHEALADPVRRPHVVFAQEAFTDWLELMHESGYQACFGVERGWKTRAALLFRSDLEIQPFTEADLPHLGYHGNYVAAGRWNRPDGSSVILASVHASPDYADPVRYHWPERAGVPTPRDGGADPRWPSQRLWDSDYLLVTLAALVEQFGLPVLAAGDFNESRLDGPEGGTWGAEYFKHAEQLGLKPWLHEVWQQEQSTRRGVQLDHILVGGGAEALLTTDPAPCVDRAWNGGHAASELSDHAAIWFALAP